MDSRARWVLIGLVAVVALGIAVSFATRKTTKGSLSADTRLSSVSRVVPEAPSELDAASHIEAATSKPKASPEAPPQASPHAEKSVALGLAAGPLAAPEVLRSDPRVASSPEVQRALADRVSRAGVLNRRLEGRIAELRSQVAKSSGAERALHERDLAILEAQLAERRPWESQRSPTRP